MCIKCAYQTFLPLNNVCMNSIYMKLTIMGSPPFSIRTVIATFTHGWLKDDTFNTTRNKSDIYSTQSVLLAYDLLIILDTPYIPFLIFRQTST